MMDIYLTFDYELFMGLETGTVNKCLIYPMKKIVEIGEKYAIPVNIFADAAYLLQMKLLMKECPSLQEDYKAVSNNLALLSKAGHDVELHFHPQWLFSNYDEKQKCWKMDLEHYKMSDMSKNDLTKLFKEAKKILDEIIGRRTIAFRAGGYSLTSLDNYAGFLRDNGIMIDSSVCGRTKVVSRFQEYDYRNVPEKDIYRFSHDVNQEDEFGDLIEMSISNSAAMHSLLYLYKKRQLEKQYRGIPMGDGKGVGLYLSRKERAIGLFNKLIRKNKFTASIDGLMVNNLYSIYQEKLNKGDNSMVIIGHPKNTSLYSLEIFEQFIKKTKGNVRFCTLKSVVSGLVQS